MAPGGDERSTTDLALRAALEALEGLEGLEDRGGLAVIGASDDPLIVAGELRSAMREDRADERCTEIADRARDWAGLADDVVAIEVVAERHDVVARAAGEPSLLDRTVHARCEIEAA